MLRFGQASIKFCIWKEYCLALFMGVSDMTRQPCIFPHTRDCPAVILVYVYRYVYIYIYLLPA